MNKETLYDSTLNLVKAALAEDIGRGDLTSLACLEPGPAQARLIAKSAGVLSGLMPTLLVFHVVDSANRVFTHRKDGEPFDAGDTILDISGFNLTVLSSERVAINFLAHLSGIADPHQQIRQANRRDQLPDSRHPQDHSRLAATGKTRSGTRRRTQSSAGAV